MSQEQAQHDVLEQLDIINDIARRSQQLISDFISRHAGALPEAPKDPINLSGAYFDLATMVISDPAKVMTQQMSLWQDYLGLWQATAGKMMGYTTPPGVEPDKDDRRFKDPAWTENHVFDYIKQSYLITSRWLESFVDDVEGLDPDAARKVKFFTHSYVEAMSPTNFAVSNPEVMRETLETNGENLLHGLQNLLADLESGDGKLKISMTDEAAFEIGVNVAATPGKVVYRNELMELLQFDPSTKKVNKRPLLIVPPWINKYYILDLREKNSFIKWAVDQGHTVFAISWVNPGKELAHKDFADYMLEGPLEALIAIEKATGEREVNVLAYCLGGTLFAAAMAWMASPKNKARKDWQDRVLSVSYLTTLVDFKDTGDLNVFIDEAQVTALEKNMNERGYLEGSEMAATFNMMRSSDLIWSFVINNYLLGKAPFPFDLLYWNGDSTRMPAAMHSFYLRKMYMENKLSEPEGLELAGVPIDMRLIDTPAYMVSAHEDHIAPWKATYAATGLYKGDIRFVLSASGHIAGVVNPPASNKYHYWANDKIEADADVWLDKAKQHEGSWWTDWSKWVKKHAGSKVNARMPGDGELIVLEDAPGSYVKVSAR
ncbi:MAG: class I poly(R)-hydroxyalkanoic acid synthase [Rhodospirillales bacterium]|jgi:polyhydroxyalkanoate synthase subunit PhaC|nr:class I poly(R)-hydroxyalkanoic acid synthase [Rhodospirillales bacterium]